MKRRLISVAACMMVCGSAATLSACGFLLAIFQIQLSAAQEEIARASTQAVDLARQRKILSGWTRFPGARSSAYLALTHLEDFTAPDRQHPAIYDDALAVSPTNGELWISRAERHFQDARSLPEAFGDLRTSFVVQPHHADQMFVRAVLVIQHWHQAPPDMKSMALSQISEISAFIREPSWVFLKRLSASLDPYTRSDIRARLDAAMPATPSRDRIRLRDLFG